MALCEARGTSVPITTAHKRLGTGGWRKNHSSLHEQGPTKHHTLYFNGPIWGFQSCTSLAFEKARQEPAQWVTRGLEEESDLRGWRRRRSPPPPPPPQPAPYTFSGTCLFSGRCCGVMLNAFANLRKRTGERNRPQRVEKRARVLLIPSSNPNHPHLAPINTVFFRTNRPRNLLQASINGGKH